MIRKYFREIGFCGYEGDRKFRGGEIELGVYVELCLRGKNVARRRMWMLGEIDGEGREVSGIGFGFFSMEHGCDVWGTWMRQ